MNRSYSKIRHIEKSNLILEKRNSQSELDRLIGKVLIEEPQDFVKKIIDCFAAQKISIKIEDVPQACSRIVAAIMKQQQPQGDDIVDCTGFITKKLGIEAFTKGRAIMDCIQKSVSEKDF